jgi:hypothetical protein
MSNMKVPELLQDYINTSIAMEESWENFSDPARIPFDAIADQAEVDAAEGLFGVYLSAIDYDDEYYTLMDSIETYRNHEFQYDGGMMLVFKTDDFQHAQDIAEDLHQVILRATSIQEFQDRHGLQLQPDLIQNIGSLNDCRDFSLFHRDWGFDIISWCQAQNLSFGFLDNFDDQGNDIESDCDFFEAQEEVCQELLSNADFDRLDQLRIALKIGRFAFVHPATHA